MLPPDEEKRRRARYDLELNVRYALKGRRKFGNTITRDLSEAGIGLVLDEFIAPATDMFLELNMPSKVINALGKVVWVEKLPYSYRYRVGIQFSEMDNLEKRDISHFLQVQQPII